MSLLVERKRELLEELSAFSDPLSRLEYLMDLARSMDALPPDQCTEDNRVQGCMSNLWLVAEAREGRCWFRCRADSLVVQSIAGLLCRFYSGATPDDILAHDPSFLRAAGIAEHLSANRRNALTKVWDRIRLCAESSAAVRRA
ncbi:MAG: SufE family protein [Kiritimatiellae bacterium]|nr:SufE family protein [Kiritimatiellia bacterium]MDW8457721.1 SufE family protein [Verrucomicrobiota bacterium]